MANYRRWQPSRPTASINWRLIAIAGGSLVAIVLLGTWVFGRGSDQVATSNEPSIRLINDVNTDSLLSTEPVNDNANTNTAPVTTTTTAPTIDANRVLSACPNALSSIGTEPAVALTFDIAADNEATGKLIETLKAKNIPASFFITAVGARELSTLLERLAAAGFPVHSRGRSTTTRYGALPAATIEADLTAADEAISAATGQTAKPFFRPPFGDTSPSAAAAAKTAGYCTILWTVDANDWDSTQTVDGSVARVMEKAKGGAILLLHAGYDITPGIVDRLATDIPAKSLRFASLAELFPAP